MRACGNIHGPSLLHKNKEYTTGRSMYSQKEASGIFICCIIWIIMRRVQSAMPDTVFRIRSVQGQKPVSRNQM